MSFRSLSKGPMRSHHARELVNATRSPVVRCARPAPGRLNVRCHSTATVNFGNNAAVAELQDEETSSAYCGTEGKRITWHHLAQSMYCRHAPTHGMQASARLMHRSAQHAACSHALVVAPTCKPCIQLHAWHASKSCRSTMV